MKQRKAQLIKARVSTNMKRGINDVAHQRGESEAVIVREALSQYLSKSAILLDHKRPSRRKKQEYQPEATSCLRGKPIME